MLASIDLFVLCSLHEGLPMSLLEAISLEVPVVCTDVGGIKEVITQNHSGLLVPSNDHHRLTEAINKLIKNEALRDKFTSNAKKVVEQAFYVDNTNKKLIDLYHDILRSH
jgi:glycosyltransferase involved in cell wall biosynthesis